MVLMRDKIYCESCYRDIKSVRKTLLATSYFLGNSYIHKFNILIVYIGLKQKSGETVAVWNSGADRLVSLRVYNYTCMGIITASDDV